MPDDVSSDNRPTESGQPDHGLCQHNPTDAIVRRGKEALTRLRRGYEDWQDIADALDVGRSESMRAAHTNEPKGKRYESEMAKWLLANSFHLIDKAARKRALECRQHRAEIEKWRVTLTEAERFRFNHPDTVLRKWRASTVVPETNPPKTSAISKLKEINIELQERLHRAEREIEHGGGDLWRAEDRAEHIARVMLGKLSNWKAGRVARLILKQIREGKKAAPAKPAAQDATATADERKALNAAEETGAS
jgi:hypothetical protein